MSSDQAKYYTRTGYYIVWPLLLYPIGTIDAPFEGGFQTVALLLGNECNDEVFHHILIGDDTGIYYFRGVTSGLESSLAYQCSRASFAPGSTQK